MDQNILKDEFNHSLEEIKRVEEIKAEYLYFNIIGGCLVPIISLVQASFEVNCSLIKSNKRNPYLDFRY